MSDIWAIPTRAAGSWSTTVTSHGNTMVCIPELANQELVPARYQGKARAAGGTRSDQPRADVDLGDEGPVHRAAVGDLEQPPTLLGVEGAG